MSKPTASKWKVRDLTLIALFAAIIAVCAWITIPLPGVPFTLQVFGIFAALCMLGGKRGTICIALYILLGAVGLPVFSGFQGGFGVLLGTTGGYIAGFLLSGLTFWVLSALFKREEPWFLAGLCVLSLLVCYAFGTAWFMIVYLQKTGPISLGVVLWKCVIRFIPFDLAKIGLAVTISHIIKKRIPALV